MAFCTHTTALGPSTPAASQLTAVLRTRHLRSVRHSTVHAVVMAKLNEVQISCYLDRIGMSEDARQGPPSMQQLRALVTAHQATIPFENLSREWLLREACMFEQDCMPGAYCIAQFLSAATQRWIRCRRSDAPCTGAAGRAQHGRRSGGRLREARSAAQVSFV